MAIQGSARIISKEIDISQVTPQEVLPDGVPAAVVGTSKRGPAYVPKTFANIDQFGDIFGSIFEKGSQSNSNKVGPLGVEQWLKNANAGTFLRVLGVGNGEAATNGVAEGAGFTLGNKLVSSSTNKIADNSHVNYYANNTTSKTTALKASRTYALGCFMKESTGSKYLTGSGIDTSAGAKPIVRGLLMTPQGVVAAMSQSNGSYRSTSDFSFVSASAMASDTTFKDFTTAGLYGYQIGTVGSDQGTKTSDSSFKVLLNGFNNSTESNVIYCNFDPDSDGYFANVMNTDPTKIEEKGHYLHSWWDIDTEVAFPRGESNANDKGFLMHTSGSIGSDPATSLPNLEKFNARFRTAKTPWFISQAFGLSSGDDRPSTSSAAGCYELFKIYALDDGEAGNHRFRVLISNVRAGINEETYGSFDLTLEDFYSDPISGTPVISWKNLSLDPDKSNYIARVIGDEHVFFDFDRPKNKQKVVSTGKFKVTNNYIRVEMSTDVEEKIIPANSLPVGFKALSTPRFAASSGNMFSELGTNNAGGNRLIDADFNADVLPIDFVRSISKVAGSSTVPDQSLPWGVKFGKRKSVDSSNKETSEISFNYSIKNWTKFYPDMGNNSLAVEDDNYQNGYFSLEKIAVTISGNSIEWKNSEYIRSGDLSEGVNSQTRFLDLQSDAKNVNIKYLKFRCILQGGFDGLNIFDEEKSKLSTIAAFREANDETSSSVFTGPTVIAYKKALDVLSDKSLTELQLLAIPGIREPLVTDYAISACEDRFDAMFVMDIQQFDESSSNITNNSTIPHVRNTISKFSNRLLDTSFAAAYFPDVVIKRPSTGSPITVPPSVGILGVIGLNDKKADPWFAPAGLNRGKLYAQNSQLTLNRDLLNELYDVDINPIYEPAGRQGDVHVFGQKTLLQDQSALDRINVRRLLINLRRKVKNIALNFLFEPNRESTLAKFSAQVEPVLADIQARQGLERYKVQIDTNTTSQNDIENNIIRGKIYVQPTKSVEFVSIDFTVTNSID